MSRPKLHSMTSPDLITISSMALRLEMKDEPGEGGRRVDPLAGLEPTPLRCTVILLGEGLTRGRAVAAGIRRSMDA